MPVGKIRATRSPRRMPRLRRPPQTASARSRTSPQPNQVACSERSTKRSPPSGWCPAAKSQSSIVPFPGSAKLSPHDGHEVADRLDGPLVQFVQADPKSVLYLRRQGQQVDRVEPQVLDQPHLRGEAALPSQVELGHIRSEEHTSELQSRQYLV